MPNHQAFGLRISSEFSLHLPRSAADNADVSISLGSTPERISQPLKCGPRFEVSADELLLEIDGVARFWARGGHQIVVEPRRSPTPHDEISQFLAGSVLGFTLQQRCRCSLHASAVVHNEQAILFAGRSGCGKSTTVSALARAGFERLCDDICPIELKAGNLLAYPGVPASKLWPDSAAALGISANTLERVRPGTEKRFLPWTEPLRDQPLPIGAVFLLHPSSETGVQSQLLSPIEAFASLQRHTYRRDFLLHPKSLSSHFQALSSIAKSIPVSTLRHSSSKFDLDAQTDRIRSALAL